MKTNFEVLKEAFKHLDYKVEKDLRFGDYDIDFFIVENENKSMVVHLVLDILKENNFMGSLIKLHKDKKIKMTVWKKCREVRK